MSTALESKTPRLVHIQTKTPPTNFNNRLQTGTTRTLEIDIAGLEANLRASVEGEVRFSAGDRGMYASDASNYRMVPIGVVLPRHADDVEATVAACREHGAPIFARGGGTAIPGQTVNSGVLLDFSKYMNRIVELDPKRKRARVEPGVVLDQLRNAANQHGLTFGPDPATHSRCTLGGMIGNNSCGVHSVMAGETSDNIEELEILTYDSARFRVAETSDEQLSTIIRGGGRRAEIYAQLRQFTDKHADLIRKNFHDIPRRVSGYNLPALLPENGFHLARALVGSECTCVLVLEATTKLVDWPPVRSLLVIGYEDIFHAADHVTEPLPFNPLALEALDDTFIEDMKKKGMHPKNLNMMPEGKAWLLVEFGGQTKEDSDANARKLMDHLSKSEAPPPMKLFDNPVHEKLIWSLREEGLGATAKIPGEPDNHEGWEDSSVPPENLGKYLRNLQQLLDKYNYIGPLYGHFGEGCVHTRLTFDLETADGIAKWRRFLEEAADLVTSYGGSLSGEHGDGQARGELLPRMFDEEMIEAFREFKQIWDPRWKMNPGKLIDPFRIDENLRLGTHWNPPQVQTHFQYPDDHRSFAIATERCVGAGVCRQHENGTMCPSYMVTREEKHSTRGRARLLGEMIRGETITDGWKSEEVKEALDLCLACKGCKGECPVQVDMAVYKAEFLSHYYEGRFRPRTAYTMGHIHNWARLASMAPAIANFFTHAPGFGSIAKVVADVHSQRTIPRFSHYTFKDWFRKRARQRTGPDGGERVILWPDTFNNYFHPQTAQAAVEVLEAAGFRVQVPAENLCCGRPLYDWGMLDEAKLLLRHILGALKEPIEAGVPVVVLEPSCATVFHEEMRNFFPNDEDAKRLKEQTFLLADFLEEKAPDFQPPKLSARALVHGHCHHKSIFKMDGEEAALKKLGLDYEMPETGCCGMAGAFGFENDNYDIAMRCGERVLLPAVRNAPNDALIITDGFSCREQIAQSTNRKALHTAEVIAAALRRTKVDGEFPEHNVQTDVARGLDRNSAILLGAGAALAAGGVWLGLRQFKKRSRDSENANR
ncbi:MAG TPA: FAD-linked oxidase C-terminal domain-containing protein [Pyrinomonadaceae bacterium]|nr:FAD-linked oxidase C-terminal domain-containing protein [Pyrinomonadaceae bacterium]